MSELLLPSLRIQNFRCFQDLQIEKLGRVNLIVGKNNVGKTALLEALWLYASEGTRSAILEVIESRDETNEPLIKNLFFGRRNISLEFLPEAIRIEPVDENRVGLSIHIDLRQLSNGNSQPIPEVLIQYGERINTYDIELKQTYFYEFDARKGLFLKISGFTREEINNLWATILKNDSIDLVLKLLRDIFPELPIKDLYIPPTKKPIPMVRLNTEEGIALRSLGEGINRLFGLILALVNAKDNFLLIDEIETGLHYSVQNEVWQFIFDLAQRLNVQVFATTHSKDCLEAFEKVALENEKVKGVLIRLEERKGRKIAVTFNEKELEYVIDKGELR